MAKTNIFILALASSLALAWCLDGIYIDRPQDGTIADSLSVFYEMENPSTVASTFSFGGTPRAQQAQRASGSVVSGAPAVSISGARIAEAEKKKHHIENLMKLGLVISAIDMYRDDIQHYMEKDEASVQNIYNHFHAPPTTEYYIEIHGGNFVVGGHDAHGNSICRILYLSGTNKYEFVEAGAGAPFLFDGKLQEKDLTGPEVVRRVMQDARDQGLDFIRFNAFAVDPEFSAIKSYDPVTQTLQVNEGVMRGLDYILDQARLHNLKVILIFTDYFADRAGGPSQLATLANPTTTFASDVDAKAFFYSDSASQTLFQNYISAVANRVNSYNGRVYRQDPVIMAWDIMNEPRCESQLYCSSSTTISNFVVGAYTYLKSVLSVKQSITVGTEGFYSNNGTFAGVYGVDPPPAVNPIDVPDAALADFADLCAIVDFCEYNMYPDLYNQENKDWIKAWIAAHSATGHDLNKPVIIKEQGMQPTNKRREFYAIMYNLEYAQILTDKTGPGGLRGAAYFQIWAKGTEAAFFTLAIGGRFGILPNDPEIYLIRQFSAKVQELSRPTINIQLCPADFSGTPLVLQEPECPLGYAGVGCNDIDECVLGLDECSLHAQCVNTPGKYSCDCIEGFYGNGKACFALPISLYRIERGFYTKDTLSCISSSQDVPYPASAPGYVEDPTGFFPDGGSSNRVPVTLSECKIACAMAEECSSFYFDPIQGTCILKKNECPYVQTAIDGCNPSQCDHPDCSAPNVSICQKEVYEKNSPAPPVPGTYNCTRGVTYFKRGFNYTDNNALCVAPSSR